MIPALSPRLEPVRLAAVVRVVAYALVLFGFELEPELFATTVIPAVELIAATLTRRRVTPVAALEPPAGGAGHVPPGGRQLPAELLSDGPRSSSAGTTDI